MNIINMSYIYFLYGLQIAIEIVAIKSNDNPETKGLGNLLNKICALSIVSGLQLEALKCILKMIVNISLPNNQENKLCLEYFPFLAKLEISYCMKLFFLRFSVPRCG